MSLTLTLSTALSGLMTSQRGLDNVAHNVSNVNTPGYTRKVMRQESVTLAGKGAGVQVADIIRKVDEGVLRSLRVESANRGYYQAMFNSMDRLQGLLGNPADSNSISHQIQRLTNDLEALAGGMEGSIGAQMAVRSFESVSQALSRLTQTVQSMRTEIDREISSAVRDVNNQIEAIHALNVKITNGATVGQDVSGLRDARDQALNALSETLDIRYNYVNDAAIIYTPSGQLLLEAVPIKLEAMASTQLTSGLEGGGVRIQGTKEPLVLRSGTLKGLLDVRDTTLPEIQSNIDELAHQMIREMNMAHNRGTSWPETRSEITGSRVFMNSNIQKISMTEGDTSITIFDQDGNSTANTTLKTIMIEAGRPASGPWTIDDMAAQVQNWLNTSGGLPNATVAVNGTTGKLEFNLASTTQSIGFQDQRTNIYDSQVYAGVNTATGIVPDMGLTFLDSTGTSQTLTFTAPDPLNPTAPLTAQEVVDQINTVAGLKAELVSVQGGYRLRVTSTFNRDLTVTDTVGTDPGARAALGLLPSRTAQVQDAKIAFNIDGDQWGASSSGITAAQNALTISNLRISGLDTNHPITLETLNLGGGPPDMLEVRATINGVTASTTFAADTFNGSREINVPLGDGVRITFDAAGLNLTQGASSTIAVTQPPTYEEQVEGFSYFFGLNDVLGGVNERSVYDSALLSADFRTGAEATTFRIIDSNGQVGSDVRIPGGADLQTIADSINAAFPPGYTYGGAVEEIGWTLPPGQAGTLTLRNAQGNIAGTVTLTAGMTMQQVSAAINAVNGVTAEVVTDAGGQRLSFRADDGSQLALGGTSSLSLVARPQVEAKVVKEGDAYRIRITNPDNREMGIIPLTGNGLTMMGVQPAASGAAAAMHVRADLLKNPNLLSQGQVQFNDETNRIFLNAGDNSISNQLAAVMSKDVSFSKAGKLPGMSASFASYAATFIASAGNETNHAQQQLVYQKSLTETLELKISEESGVNLDEELAQMLVYQQSYQAAARLISATQKLMDILTELV